MRRRTFAPLLVLGLALELPGVPRAEFAQDTSGGRYHEAIPGTLVTFEMVRVPAGRVTLPGAEGRGQAVEVAEFFIGRTEVTWDMFDVYTLRLDAPRASAAADAVARPSEPYGAPDRGWGHAGFPVMSVTAQAAEAFCRWLSATTGKAYRLPTDAEWSRAAQLAAGPGGLAPARLDLLAWHRGHADGRTHPVGRRAPDALGLLDLFGNVAEWVSTGAAGFVTRGGSYRDAAPAVGPDARAAQDATWNQTDPQLPKSRWWLSDGPFVGFRLVAPSPGGSP